MYEFLLRNVGKLDDFYQSQDFELCGEGPVLFLDLTQHVCAKALQWRGKKVRRPSVRGPGTEQEWLVLRRGCGHGLCLGQGGLQPGAEWKDTERKTCREESQYRPGVSCRVCQDFVSVLSTLESQRGLELQFESRHCPMR